MLYRVEAIVEEDARAVAIPRDVFDSLIAETPEFCRFVFTAFSRRVTDLFRVIEEVAFERIDIRLAHRLLALSGADKALAITHQPFAAKLGSAREVISRQLAEFQRRGWIESSRGGIRFLNKDAFRRLAETH